MDDVGHPVHDHSAAALLCSLLIPVLRVHLLHRKVAILVLKATVVHGKELAEDLALNLLHEVIDGVAVNEGTLLGIVGVQVEVKGKAAVMDEVTCELFNGIDCGLFVQIRIDVVPIQVFAVAVHAEMTVIDPIHVDHWNYHEDEHLLQQK
jgi:hypothetical protein